MYHQVGLMIFWSWVLLGGIITPVFCKYYLFHFLKVYPKNIETNRFIVNEVIAGQIILGAFLGYIMLLYIMYMLALDIPELKSMAVERFKQVLSN